MTNCYKTLGVKDFASIEEIKTAYRKLSKKFHPDLNDGDKFFEERFKEIQFAYEILSDKQQKEIHDANLKDLSSNSSNFNFREHSRNTNKKQNQSPGNSGTAQATEEKKKPEPTDTHLNQTNERQRRYSRYIPLGIFIIAIVITTIIIITNKKNKEENNDDYISQNNPSSNYYPSQPNQSSTYNNPEINSQDDRKLVDISEGSQPYSSIEKYFILGSSKTDVLEAQGDPTEINKHEMIGEEVWWYGTSSVTFQNGRVKEYSKGSKKLKVKVTTSNRTLNILSYFTLGSSKKDVLEAQGDPTEINKHDMIGEEVWWYGTSSVTFQNGRVKEYSKGSKNLNVKVTTTNRTLNTLSYFTLGSTKKDVLEAQGDPTEINKHEMIGEEVWWYGTSSVTFQNGRVKEYSKGSRNLNVKVTTTNRTLNTLSYFTLGSTKKDVLEAQGDPTEINKHEMIGEEVWWYGTSSVTFQNGRVKEYSKGSKRLNVRL